MALNNIGSFSNSRSSGESFYSKFSQMFEGKGITFHSFTGFDYDSSEGMGEALMDWIWVLVALGLLFFVVIQIGGFDVFFGKSMPYALLGLFLTGIGALGLFKKAPDVVGERKTAFMTVGILLLLFAGVMPQGGFQELFETPEIEGEVDGEPCSEIMTADRADFGSYVSQLQCVGTNVNLLFVSVIMFFFFGVLLTAFVPGTGGLVGWAFSAVITLFAMRIKAALNTFYLFVKLGTTQTFTILLIFGVMFAIVKYKQHEIKKKEAEAKKQKASAFGW